ncbi:MAG: sodium-dependent transporter [Candidatus Margulisbacteria bacterium]|nr:sodium-dependent transporter [Candidatus Margulisiibacteriota bacterium]MBU1021271.1 sodium-dependent transporter [Candidatus Margulisiibacteriota bacterium]MBU1729240.1 sodium-dependent transporter [Candidatus Margulisiibacteriota bacterium]MBU1954913.1 sodium-dependent transporter [Candidatus Margulisiibacteriota bacterium]
MQKRASWGSQMGFILAAIGSAIGLGNIWRFSYMTYKNGGGAFLIPYLVALLIVGFPLLILEYGLGHKKHGASSLAFAKISRKIEWLGWWMPTFAYFGIMLFYTVIIGWCVNFMIYSINLSWGADPEAFFIKNFLQLSSSSTQIGSLVLPIVFSLAFVWLVCWFICFREVNHGIEKACIIFMPLLFVLTMVLIGWGFTLPGALEGIKWYLKPDFSKIMNWEVWMAAFGQIFFTLTLSFGVMIAYASYLPKKTDIVRNAYLTGIINCFYSFIMGFAVFSVLGYMANQAGVPVSEVVKSGVALAFIVFPKAISQLPAFNNIFGILFFGTLVIAGLSSAISLVEAFSRALTDKFDWNRKTTVHVLCVLGFLGSLLFATQGGLYFIDIVDHFINYYGLVLAGALECLLIGWVLKAHVLRNHINAVSGSHLNKLWDYLIKFVVPAILIITLLINLVKEISAPYEGYSIVAILILGVLWLVGTALLALIFTIPKWEKAKLEYNHFAEEDKLLV